MSADRRAFYRSTDRPATTINAETAAKQSWLGGFREFCVVRRLAGARVILPATSRPEHASNFAMMLRAAVFALLSAVAAPAAISSSWVDGEMGYRVTIVPAGSVASRHGLRLGDILAEPAALPQRLADAGPGGVEIPVYRLDAKGAYQPAKLKIVFREGEEHRLGTTGDLGFLVTAIARGSLGARAELKPGDFIPRINETFVHSDADLKLVDDAYAKGEPVLTRFARWTRESGSFVDGVSRQTFAK